jgi:uncharacterized protein (DUF486 family)
MGRDLAADRLERVHALRRVRAPEESRRPALWYWAALVSWAIACFEYLLQVPGNRVGYPQLTLPQPKVPQEVITRAAFVPFAVPYMHQPLKLDYLWAAACILGAVYFVFRSPGTP